MRTTGRMGIVALGTAVLAAIGGGRAAPAHEGHDHGAARHGGVEAKTARHRFEAVFSPGGLKLFAVGADGAALDASRLAAIATFYHPNAPGKAWFSRELKPSAAAPGKAAPSLDVAMDLRGVPAAGTRVAFRVSGLADPAEPSAEFTAPFTPGRAGILTVAAATGADAAALAALRACPVSGEPLGSMGAPLKVSLDGLSTFVCCKGCVKTVQADPDRFLAAAKAPAAPKAAGAGGHGGHAH
jgi:hypothetical protein